MAAATSRRPSGPANGNSVPLQQITSNGVAGTISNGRQRNPDINPAVMSYGNENEYIPRAVEGQPVRTVSYRGNVVQNPGGGVARSFSTRAKDLPVQWSADIIDDPISPVQEHNTQSRPSTDPSSANIPVSNVPVSAVAIQGQDARKLSSSSESASATSLLSRNNTVRSIKDQRHDWASDRSPLQKLEVTLGGISKEEKRARVQEAEMRLREKLARQKSESSKNEPKPESKEKSAAHVSKLESKVPERTASNRTVSHEQQSKSPKGDIQVPKRGDTRRLAPAGPTALDIQAQGQSEKPRPARNRAASVNVGCATVHPGKEPQFATAEIFPPPIENRGTIPRRPVPTGSQRDPHGRGTARNRAPTMSAPENAQPLQTPSYPESQERQDRSTQQVARGKEPYRGVDSQQLAATVPPPPMTTPPMDVAERDFAPVGLDLDQETADENYAALQDIQNEQSVRSKPKKQTVSFDMPPPTPPPLFEWRTAPVAKLCDSDFDLHDIDLDRSKAWWAGGASANRRESRALPKNYQRPAQQTTLNKHFQPPIFLKCGPLLRYTGMKRVQIDGSSGPIEKETWRGSIMIVTKDSRSSYESPPSLRLFSQPMDILPPPPSQVESQLPPEYVDPTAGLMKVGRDGRPLYVKPVDDTEEEIDLSFIENDDGLYEQTPSRLDFSEGIEQPIPANRIHPVDGETVGIFKDTPGIRLYADPDRDVTFWRFNIEVELGEAQRRIAYRINQGPALGFWVPASGQSMNIAFYTCNGFSSSADSNKVCGPDPLWRDILNEHQTRPFHVMIGGGDQIFNDRVIVESTYFQEWVKIKNVHEKYNATFSPEFKADLENYFLERYSMWFSQGLYSLANSQIPMVNIWNDHEIIEGFGSYPDEFMRTSVISGLGKIAFKYYMLFQHQSVPEETDADEPSWLLGAQPGPYIKQRSRNLLMSLGKDVALLGLDCRTERISSEILSEETCDLIWDRCYREIVRGETKHLIVLSSIPITYPRVAMVKNILNSRKSLGKAGIFGGLLNKYGGRVEIFDDHWTAKHLKPERGWLIEDLQDLAAEKSVRVTILSGDVHLAAIGRFYSNAKLDMPKDKDYRYMPNVISSAIADMPETEMISDMLNKRNRVHHMDTNTEEDIIPIFTHDVDGKPRNNKRLLPRRNWCSIRAYQPGSTPPATPESPLESPVEPRPAKLQRTLSLTRGDGPTGGLLRRLSQRGGRPLSRGLSLGGGGAAGRRRMSLDGPFPPPETGDSYFPPHPDQRPNPFARRPTNLSQKTAKKATRQGDNGAGAPINLEGGLAISLNLEISPKDPSGITTPYKLLVPMLRYDGGIEYVPEQHGTPATSTSTKVPKRSWTKWLGVRRNKKKSYLDAGLSDDEGEHDDDEDDANYEGFPGSDDDDDSPLPPEDLIHVGQPSSGTNVPGQAGQGPRKKWFKRA